MVSYYQVEDLDQNDPQFEACQPSDGSPYVPPFYSTAISKVTDVDSVSYYSSHLLYFHYSHSILRLRVVLNKHKITQNFVIFFNFRHRVVLSTRYRD